MAKKDDNKLCARGKRAAKAKYDTYPSAYANGYAVQVCKGKKPDASGNKKKASGYRKGGYIARKGEFSKGGLAEWFGKNDGKGWVVAVPIQLVARQCLSVINQSLRPKKTAVSVSIGKRRKNDQY